MDNILLVTVDSLRADHLGCYGYDRPTSPFIDEFAAESHRFENAFANAQATKHSFPAILTSTYPLMYGGSGQLSDEQTVVAKPLSEAGYRTGGFHSNPFLSADFGYDEGFDVFYESESDRSVLSALREWVKSTLDDEGLVYRLLKSAFDTTEKHAGIEIGSSYVPADTITDRAIEFVREGPESGNFLWVHYMDVHHPYLPPDDYQTVFRDEPVSDRESIRLRRKMLEEPAAVSADERQTIIDLYDAEIRFMDTEFRRLLDALDEEWTSMGTFFTSDHGEEFREHGAFSHSTLHEEGIHIPLLVDVDESGGVVHDELVALIDIAPTLVDYADGAMPDTYRGKSFRPILEGGDWENDHIIGEAGHQDDGTPREYYRDTQWKFIADDGTEWLYNIESDPDEETDLADERPEKRTEIKSILEEHRSMVSETTDSTGEVEVSEEMEQRLEALGYKE